MNFIYNVKKQLQPSMRVWKITEVCDDSCLIRWSKKYLQIFTHAYNTVFS